MSGILDYTVGMVVLLSHLFWIAVQGEERPE